VLKGVVNDVDLLGATLDSYSWNVVASVIAVGRAGTLVDWHGEGENPAYLSSYAAESILNWRQIRVDGHVKLSLLVLSEQASAASDDDPFIVEEVPQLRVLKLVPVQPTHPNALREPRPLAPALSPEGERGWVRVCGGDLAASAGGGGFEGKGMAVGAFADSAARGQAALVHSFRFSWSEPLAAGD